MPTFRRYLDGQGFFIIGHVPGVGFSTWQIGKPGLECLKRRGIKNDGDRIGLSLLRELQSQGLVTTGGQGVSDTGAVGGRSVAHLVQPLELWARRGFFPELTRIIHGGGDFRDVCFSSRFVAWLAGLDDSVPLYHFDGLTLSAFEDLAAPCLDGLKDDALHRWFVLRGSVCVVWRLARLVGLVSRQLRAGPECPADWEGEPVLVRLFDALRPQSGLSPAPAPRLRLRHPPRIEWRAADQEVIAALPGQLLPLRAETIVWTVEGRTVCPRTVRTADGHRVDEAKSLPLRPHKDGAEYLVEARFQSGCERLPERWSFSLPMDDSPFVLFRRDGVLIGAEESESLMPGVYMALIPQAKLATARALQGAALIEEVEVGPLGWSGWSGWRLSLCAGATVGPYSVADSLASWELEPPPVPPVRWLDADAVWLGGLPTVHVSSDAHFRGATVEVATEDGVRFFRAGTDLPLRVHNGRMLLDLSAVPVLAGVFGRFVLTCRPIGRIEGTALTLRFVRLPAIDLDYVPDQRSRGTAMAVRVRGAQLTPGPDTELHRTGVGEVILRSQRPAEAPGVIAALAVGGTLRVRVPVTRAGRVDRTGEFGGWQSLPLATFDLATVHRDDRLRVEFHADPPTEDNKLFVRVAGASELLTGTRLGRAGAGTLYEIELHRLRDGFGIGSTGSLQVHGPDGWLPLFDARGLAAAEPRSQRLTGWQRILADLDTAVGNGDRTSATELIARCLSAEAQAAESPVVRNLFALRAAGALLATPYDGAAWARAMAVLEPLLARTDLPDAAAVAFRLECRREHHAGGRAVWTLERLTQARGLPTCAEKDAVLAEAYYNLARTLAADTAGCWRSCEELAASVSNRPTRGLAFSDALLLRDLARVMLGARHAHSDPLPVGVLPGHAPWLAAVRFLGEYVGTAWPRPKLLPDASRLDHPPAVLRPEDVALLRAAQAQAQGFSVADDATRAVWDWTDRDFDVIGLLRARRARFAGDRAAAVAAYRQLMSIPRDGLLDVIAGEQFTT